MRNLYGSRALQARGSRLHVVGQLIRLVFGQVVWRTYLRAGALWPHFGSGQGEGRRTTFVVMNSDRSCCDLVLFD